MYMDLLLQIFPQFVLKDVVICPNDVRVVWWAHYYKALALTL